MRAWQNRPKALEALFGNYANLSKRECKDAFHSLRRTVMEERREGRKERRRGGEEKRPIYERLFDPWPRGSRLEWWSHEKESGSMKGRGGSCTLTSPFTRLHFPRATKDYRGLLVTSIHLPLSSLRKISEDFQWSPHISCHLSIQAPRSRSLGKE